MHEIPTPRASPVDSLMIAADDGTEPFPYALERSLGMFRCVSLATFDRHVLFIHPGNLTLAWCLRRP